MAEPTQWWMFHGDPAHTGYVTGSTINAAMLESGKFGLLHSMNVGGSILSVPAVCDGFIYVGLANSRLPGQVSGKLKGGSLLKIDLTSYATVQTFNWVIDPSERDAHGFCGMGSTPTVIGGFVYFVGFNAKLYCLDVDDFSKPVWVTDLRNADLPHNQPIQNFDSTDPNPPAAGWSAPLYVNGRLYLGIGEGENPNIYSFVFCLDAATGNVVWVFCTNQFVANAANLPNHIPARAVVGDLPAMFTVQQGEPITRGCSVWGNIAYDESLDRLYCPTGNGVPDGSLPTAGYSNGVLSLDASTGAFVAFMQTPPSSNYRQSDFDVDIGASPILFNLARRRVVGIGSKNGSFFVLDAETLEIISQRQLLPYFNDGTEIPNINRHPSPEQMYNNVNNPAVDNLASDVNQGENYSGIYSTATIDPVSQTIFVGLGGKNYQTWGAGIDTATTPFMRAMKYADLSDAWPVDDNDPPRYKNAMTGTMQSVANGPSQILAMYQNEAESGLSTPAVVNDLVFMATTNVSIYAFRVSDGTPLWTDKLGEITQGMSGGYGYCMGPAICGDVVVAGALVYGNDGGILKIYGPTP
ncbi:MAG TPA: hypothetical protein VEA61_02935 [Allosphingosinicella sp.]|nr:hypothetical protein [Allosphingosinicella sp.]